MSDKVKLWKLVLFIIIVIVILWLFLGNNVYKTTYQDDIKAAISKYSDAETIDYRLILSIIKESSGFDPKKVSSDGDKGLMQISNNTFNEISNLGGYDAGTDIMDPKTNICVGVIYLDRLLAKYDNNIYVALIAYKAGYKNVDTWIAASMLSSKHSTKFVSTPNNDANSFLNNVMTSYEHYKTLH